MILVLGASGTLGKQLMVCLGRQGEAAGFRLEDKHYLMASHYEGLILAAGTKGFAACEGNAAAFRADVDGNIWYAREASKSGIFTLFISTDAVEVAAGSAYARNRLLVELAIGHLPHIAILRPGKFDATNAFEVAKACVSIVDAKSEGLHRWP